MNLVNLASTFTLNNGITIPCIGYGTWQTPSGEVAEQSVLAAIESGYRHIDCAAAYGNEDSVGAAIRKSGIDRKQLFITGKLLTDLRGYETTFTGFEKTLSDLGLDYLDLYLIHWPAAAHRYENWEQINLDTWRAMTELYKAGKIRAIGVSNFKPHHLKALMETEVKPMVNQIEYHPGYIQDGTVAFCRENGILVEAWSPLGSGRVLADGRLNAIAQRYGKSVAQLCVRFALQNGVLPLPKSVTPARIEENSRVFDFEIFEEDMAYIRTLPEFGWSGNDPDKVDW